MQATPKPYPAIYDPVSNTIQYPLETGWTSIPNSTTPGSGTAVGRVALTNQGSDISSTALYTVPTTGLYYLMVYAVTTTSDAGAGATTSFDITWTDDSGAQAFAGLMVFNLTSKGAIGENNLPVNLVAGSQLKYAISGGGPYGAARYSLYVSLITV